jgi:hypothetical protein
VYPRPESFGGCGAWPLGVDQERIDLEHLADDAFSGLHKPTHLCVTGDDSRKLKNLARNLNLEMAPCCEWHEAISRVDFMCVKSAFFLKCSRVDAGTRSMGESMQLITLFVKARKQRGSSRDASQGTTRVAFGAILGDAGTGM